MKFPGFWNILTVTLRVAGTSLECSRIRPITICEDIKDVIFGIFKQCSESKAHHGACRGVNSRCSKLALVHFSIVENYSSFSPVQSLGGHAYSSGHSHGQNFAAAISGWAYHFVEFDYYRGIFSQAVDVIFNSFEIE